MSNKQRYLTRGINENIPIELQCYLWNLIDTMAVDEKDYLQVFDIKNTDTGLEITHSQECPEYSKIHRIHNYFNDTVDIKIFVIDSDDYSTMLFAHEY